MSDYEFGRYRAPRIRLMDAQLTLDPETIRIMEEIQAQMAARQMINLWLRPNWQSLMPSWQLMLTQQPLFPTQRQPSGGQFVPGAGPSTPRPGDLSDVTSAIYQLPAVQRLVNQAHDEGNRQLGILRREWETASPGDRAVMVSMGGIVAGSTLAIILANQQTRQLAFNLIKGHDIPIPGVDGLSFQILDRGGSVTAPLGVPGLSGSARLQLPSGAPPDYQAMVNFDVMEFIRSRR
jgi:hypothetical protein